MINAGLILLAYYLTIPPLDSTIICNHHYNIAGQTVVKINDVQSVNSNFNRPRMLQDKSSSKPVKTQSSVIRRWIIPTAITVGAGITIYTIYSARGR